jgi:EmrB/QacA subfamily drug resistance transporter
MTRRYQVLLVVSAAVFVVSLDLFIVNIALPSIQDDFPGQSLGALSWILNAYAIVFAALLVPAGRLADLLGRKRGFLLGLTLFTVASVLCAAAPSLGWLIAGRVLQAAGGALLMPTALGLLLPEFPPEQRGAAVGAWAAVGGVAAAFGPPLGGLLTEVDWRWIFLVNVPVGAVTLVAGRRILREARDPGDGRLPDLVGAALLAAAIGSLTLALVQGGDWGWGSARIDGLFAATVVLLALFGVRSARHPRPVVEPELLRVRSFAMANLGAVLFLAAFGAMLITAVLFLTDVWGWSALRAGVALVPGPLMAAVFSPPSGKLSDRYGQRAVGIPGGILFALGCLWWVTQAGPQPDYAGDLLPGMILTGIGVGLTMPTLASAAAASLPPARFATGAAVLSMSRQIGAALGVAVAVAILDTGGGMEAFDRAWTFMALAAAGASLACVALGRVRVAFPTAQPAEGVAR